jgi:hypothetical protein
MKFQEIQNNPQIFKALTAYTIEQFEQLLVLFEDELEIYFQNYALNGKKRKKIRPQGSQPIANRRR